MHLITTPGMCSNFVLWNIHRILILFVKLNVQIPHSTFLLSQRQHTTFATTCTNCFHCTCQWDSNLTYAHIPFKTAFMCPSSPLLLILASFFTSLCSFSGFTTPLLHCIFALCDCLVSFAWCLIMHCGTHCTLESSLHCRGRGEQGKTWGRSIPPPQSTPLPLPILLCRLPCKVHYYFFGPANHPYMYLHVLENTFNATIPSIWPKATFRNPNVYI